MRRMDRQAGGIISRKPGQGIEIATIGFDTNYNASTGVPTDSVANYEPGCLFINPLGGAGTFLYVNQGTLASSTWQAFGPGATYSTLTVTTFTSTTATITTLTSTTATVTTLVNVAIDASAGAATLTVKAATQHAWEVTNGTTISIDVDTRTTSSGGGGVTLLGQPVSIASAGSALTAPTLDVAARTATLTGTTTTTSLLGVAARFEAQTITDASVCTLTTASAIHIVALAAAGGSLTITNSRMISTSVSDCFLTNAGVWTDTACWAWGKEAIKDAAQGVVAAIVDKIQPRQWKYRQTPEGHGFDFDRERVGIVYDELPDELLAPGEERAVSPGLLASFCLAALKELFEENKALKARLVALEAA